MGGGKIIEVDTKEDWDKQLAEAKNAGKVVRWPALHDFRNAGDARCAMTHVSLRVLSVSGVR